jgi:uroporphyrin-III C-methyltransferase
MNKVKQNKTKVYLIGAGPGDPELLTKKAERILSEADTVIYDSLVSRDIIRKIKKAVKIPAGRRKQRHSVSQQRVNELILENVMKGRVVARLKGGDPLIFGRAAEEMDFLEKHGISYEIVPGISAAQAAAACMKIPLTERGMSSSVIFCTGHPMNSVYIPPKNFKGTVVFYMAATVINEISKMFLKKGWPAGTPLAVASGVGTKPQKTYRLNLGTAAKRIKPFFSPATVIIGSVVNRQPRSAKKKESYDKYRIIPIKMGGVGNH